MQRALAVRLSGDGVPLPVPAARPGVSMQLGPPGPSGLNTAHACPPARRRSAAVDELQRAFPSVRALNTERCVLATMQQLRGRAHSHAWPAVARAARRWICHLKYSRAGTRRCASRCRPCFHRCGRVCMRMDWARPACTAVVDCDPSIWAPAAAAGVAEAAHHFLLAQLGTDLIVVPALPCPQERPLLTVLVPVQNPLVDSGGRIRCRTLDEWDARLAGKSNLVNAVREALAILTQPPSSSSSGGSAGTASTGRH